VLEYSGNVLYCLHLFRFFARVYLIEREGFPAMQTEKYRTLIPLFEELRGTRVIVRPYRENDAQSLFEAVAESREHLRPWEPFADAHQTVEESRDMIIQLQ
jgi:hypothetical protein